MAPRIRAISQSGGGVGTSLSVTQPAGTQVGDLLVMPVLVDGTSVAITSAGWTDAAPTRWQPGSPDFQGSWLTRVADTAGAQSHTVEWGAVARYRGAAIVAVRDAGGIVDASSRINAASRSITFDDVTLPAGGLSLLLALIDEPVTSVDPPSGWAEELADDVSVAAWVAADTASGPTGEVTAAVDPAVPTLTAHLAVAPAPDRALSDVLYDATGKPDGSVREADGWSSVWQLRIASGTMLAAVDGSYSDGEWGTLMGPRAAVWAEVAGAVDGHLALDIDDASTIVYSAGWLALEDDGSEVDGLDLAAEDGPLLAGDRLALVVDGSDARVLVSRGGPWTEVLAATLTAPAGAGSLLVSMSGRTTALSAFGGGALASGGGDMPEIIRGWPRTATGELALEQAAPERNCQGVPLTASGAGAVTTSTPTRWSKGFAVDDAGALAIAVDTAGAWRRGFVRTPEGALCVTSTGPFKPRRGFLRDADGLLGVSVT